MNEPEATPMERRLHTRHRARTRVHIRLNGNAKMCKAINLSANGVAVQTDGMGLKVGELVELAFAIELGQIIKVHRRQAEVRYIKAGVTGFSMHPYGERYYEVVK